mgnify:FL=1|jgi:hypothetical protein
MDNTKLARFITSLGSLNGYGSTLPTDKERTAHLKAPLTDAEKQTQSISPTIKVKEEFRSDKK